MTNDSDGRGNPRQKLVKTERQEELKLLHRAVAAGLLPAEALERALDQSGDGDSLFQHLAGDGRLSAPELDLVRQLSDSRALPAQPNASPSIADTSHESSAAEHDTTPAPAEVVRLPGLPERYERLKSIGSGGMGWVFSAHDAKLKRDVAIKVLKGERVGDSWTKMMLRESEVLARLKHPGLVPIYDVGHLADDSPYLVMPYVTGVNLDEYAAARSLSWRECVSIMRQIAEAVGHAHLVNIVHRDLKPGNIRITPEGSAVVLDFGIAKPVTDAGDSNVAETVSSGSTADPLDGAQVWKPSYETCGPGGAGTPSYMSPEQAAGDAVDLRTDVYSLGVVMYYLLAGRLPWPREVYLERKRLYETIHRQSPPALPQKRPRIPADLKAIVARCLSAAPSERYADGREVASELQRLTDGFPVEAYARKRPWYVLGKFVRRQRAAVLAVATAVAALLFAIVATMYASFNRLQLALAVERQKVEQQATEGKVREERLRGKFEAELRNATVHRSAVDGAANGLRRGELTTVRRALDEIPATRAGFETARLDLETGHGAKPTAALPGHEYELLDGALSPDRRWLATTGFDGKVLVWDLAGSRLQTVLRPGAWCSHKGHWRHALAVSECCPEDARLRDQVLRLVWMPDGKRLIGATRGGKLVAWDLDTKKESLLLQHSSPLVALAASSTGAILTADNQGRLLLGAALDATFKTFTIQSGEVSALGAVAGGWCIGSLDGRVLITDESGDQIRHEIGLRGPIWDLAFDSTENLLAIAPNESRVALVTLNSETPKAPTVRSLAMTEGICDLDAVPHAVDIDCRAGCIVAGDSTGQSTIWALASGTPEMQLKTSERGPTSENLEKFPEVYRRRSAVVALTSGGAGLWTGGANSLVMHWQVGRERLQHEWRTGPRPAAVFDRERADWVWVASGKRLEIVDSWSSRVLASTEVDGGAEIRGLVAARRSPSYATFAGQSIQFWRRTEPTTRTRDESQDAEQRIETAGLPLQHDVEVIGLALSSDGHLAATYDVRDEVVIWNVVDGRKVQTIPIVTNEAAKLPQDALPHAYGKLFFDVDDAQLLVIGPSQLPTLLSGRPWEFARNPGVASHRGPSAAAWHPTDGSRFVVGDSSGALRSEPTPIPGLPLMPSTVRGLSFTPDGRRLAIGIGSGSVSIVDADLTGVGQLAVLASPLETKARGELTALQFDPTGSRLMGVFDEGFIHIWESQPSPLKLPPPTTPTAPWRATTFAHSTDAKEKTNSNPAAIVLDAADRVAAIVMRQRPTSKTIATSPSAAGLSESLETKIEFIRELGAPVDRQAKTRGEELRWLDDLGSMPPRPLTSLHTSLALCRNPITNELDAIYSRPVVESGDYVREIIAVRHLGTSREARMQLGEPSNYGLHSTLLSDPQGNLHACHFAYSDYVTVAHRLASSGMVELFGVGRKGDLLKGVAFDRNGWLHYVGQSRRWPSDPQQQIIYRAIDDLAADFDVDGTSRQINEIIFHGSYVSALGLTVDRQGRPIVQYQTYVSALSHNQSGRRLHLATRDNGRWNHDLVLDATVPYAHVSQTVAFADGRLLIAFTRVVGLSTEVCLATRHEGRWTVQTVHVLPGDELQESPPGVSPLSLHVDSRGKLVIAGLAADHEGTRMLVLRPSSE